MREPELIGEYKTLFFWYSTSDTVSHSLSELSESELMGEYKALYSPSSKNPPGGISQSSKSSCGGLKSKGTYSTKSCSGCCSRWCLRYKRQQLLGKINLAQIPQRTFSPWVSFLCSSNLSILRAKNLHVSHFSVLLKRKQKRILYLTNEIKFVIL